MCRPKCMPPQFTKKTAVLFHLRMETSMACSKIKYAHGSAAHFSAPKTMIGMQQNFTYRKWQERQRATDHAMSEKEKKGAAVYRWWERRAKWERRCDRSSAHLIQSSFFYKTGNLYDFFWKKMVVRKKIPFRKSAFDVLYTHNGGA